MDVSWIDDPVVLGSSNPSIEDLEVLRAQGFEVLVSLLQEHVQPPKYDVPREVGLGYVRHNIPVRDFHAPSVGQLKEFNDLISDLPVGSKIIMHCEAELWDTRESDSPRTAVSRSTAGHGGIKADRQRLDNAGVLIQRELVICPERVDALLRNRVRSALSALCVDGRR
jgi:hypothetical protein